MTIQPAFLRISWPLSFLIFWGNIAIIFLIVLLMDYVILYGIIAVIFL